MERALFRIELDGKDLTSVIADRFLDLTLTDAAGRDSDTFRLSLDNRDDKLLFPATGVKLKVWMGPEGGMIYKGQYSVDEVSEALDDGVLEISGKAADMGGPIKSTKSRTWEASITLGRLAQAIAGESGYQCQVHQALAGVELGHINQKAESDLNLLTRMCEANGGLMKLGGGYLLITPRGSSEAANGVPLEAVVIDDPSESSGRVIIQERGAYGAVQTSYFDAGSQQLVNVVYGEQGATTMELKGRCKDATEALAKAKAKHEELARGRATMSLERPLTPEIVSPGKVVVVNHRQSANGVWLVESAEHYIGSGGVSRTSLQLKTVEHEASKKKK